LDCGSDGELCEAVHSPAFAMLGVFGYIEISDFAAELYGIRTGVKEFDRRNAAFSVAERGEKLLRGLGQGGDTA